MHSSDYKRAVGLFHSREQAELAVRDLKNSSYDMQNVSIIAKDADQIEGIETTEKIGNKADDVAATGAVTGGTLGGITGLLVGLGTLAIPGIGPILLAGAGATTLATTLAGVGIGAAAGGLVGALAGLGIPEDRARVYSDSVRDGGFLVIIDGTTTEVNRAETVLNHHDVRELGIYDAPDIKSPNSTAVMDLDEDMTARSDLGNGVHKEGLDDTSKLKAITVADLDEDIKARSDLNDAEKIKLYEERLIVSKHRAKAGDVSIGKHIETDVASVSVPVEKERLVIERKNVAGEAVRSEVADFDNGEVIRLDLYEETATIDKQAFVREEINVHKEVTTETVQKSESIRSEELAIDMDEDIVQH